MCAVDAELSKELPVEEFARFRDLIHEHCGIYVEDSQLDSLRASLVARAIDHGASDYGEYYERLVGDEDELRELMNLVTINETSFFRFPAQFTALRDVVVPDILGSKSKLSTTFRVWSAGCSTGEEPYSIAMTLLDSAASTSGLRCEVIGTDVSTQALERAAAALYSRRSTETVPPDMLARWFEAEGQEFRPVEQVRDLVELRYDNLVGESTCAPTLSGFDVIFCRNVTIYFRIESTRRVVNGFFDALNPGGYLFVGHSETLSGITDRFECVEVGGVFVYRKPKARRHFHAGDDHAVEEEPRLRVHVRQALATRAETPVQPSSARAATRPRAVASATAAHVSEAPAPGSGAEEALLEARELLEAGSPEDARTVAERLLEVEPRNTGAMLVSAYAHADAGDFSAAMAQANAALEIDPLLAEARYILGVIHQRQGDPEAALAEFRRTIYIDHEFVLAHFSAANLFRARGSLEDAAREYENTLRALYVNPDGSWTVFLGGFRPDLLAKTCERSLSECRKGS